MDHTLFRRLVETSWNAVEAHTIDGKVLYAGASTGRTLGYTSEEMIGKISWDLMHPDDVPLGRSFWETAVRSPGVMVPAQVRFLHKNGSWRLMEGRIINLLDDPEVRAMVVHFRDITEVTEANARLSAAMAELDRLANSDGLTGLANRACFDRQLESEWRRSSREQTPLGLILIDVDHFKIYNDTYGHVAGDECLRRVGSVIAGTINRAGDLAARYGGEEFVCILPNTPLRDTLHVAERIRSAVWNLALPHSGSATADRVTITAGIVSRAGNSIEQANELVRAADSALYSGKSYGRNCCIVEIGEAAEPLRNIA